MHQRFFGDSGRQSSAVPGYLDCDDQLCCIFLLFQKVGRYSVVSFDPFREQAAQGGLLGCDTGFFFYA